MKRHLLFMFFSFGMMAAEAQTAYIASDFEAGIPDTFSLYDLDGNEPSIDMKGIGFQTGTPWVTVKTDKETNTAACSTSWYKIAGQSDDWMITPLFEVTDPTAILRWRSMASDKEYRDGYSVYVSENGTSPEDFDKAIPLFSTKAEKSEWTLHESSLADYCGKTIAIAFVNDSRDKSCLYIDDLFAGIPSSLEISSAIPRVTAQEGEFYIEGSVKNTTSNQIDGFSIEYSINGGETYVHKESASIKAGKEYKFRFACKEQISRNQTIHYTLSVGSGSDSSTVAGKLSCYRHAVVAEEITGTWCGYCVRGIAAMARMKEDFGEDFIGIAVHAGSQTWPDPMEMYEYNGWLFNQFNMSGYPHCTVNRSTTTTGDPSNIPYYYNTYANQDNYYGLDLTADIDTKTRTVTAHTDLYCARDVAEANFRLAYAVIENDVHSEESIYWSQSNYYAGGSLGEMGGFENLPDVVPPADMWYQDVARYFSDSFDGIKDSLPSELHDGDVVGHDYTFTMPENILNDANTELIVLLLNAKNGMVVNAQKISLENHFSALEAVTNSDEIAISRTGTTLRICAGTNLNDITLYSADGKAVMNMSDCGIESEIDTDGLKGIYIVKASTDNSTIARKYIF